MPYALNDLYGDVAQVQHARIETFGSGWLIAQNLVLTARHVVTPEDTKGAVDDGWQVRLTKNRPKDDVGEWIWSEAEVVWRGSGILDLALLKIENGLANFRPTLATVIGKIDTVEHRKVLGVGFPRGARVDNRRILMVPSGELYDEGARTLTFGVNQADQPEYPGVDWKGFSGAPIVLAESPDPTSVWIYGVAQEVPSSFPRRLSVARLSKAFEEDTFRAALREAGIAPEPPSDPLKYPSTPQPRYYNPEMRASRFYFGSRPNEFLERDDPLKKLQGFLADERVFVWWILTGKAGSGKSRLALEFGISAFNTWHWGFLRDQDFNWDNWQPDRATLWVIDYAGSSAEKVGEIIESLAFRQQKLARKVRILLIERTRIGQWWDKLLGTGGRRDAVLSSIYSQNELELAGVSPDSLWRIFAHFAGLPENSLDRDLSLSLLSKIDPESRPLFAALAGDAKARGNDIRSWNQIQLLDFNRREEKRRWEPQGVREIDIALLAFVTLAGGIEVKDIPSIGLGNRIPDEDSFSQARYEIMAGVRSDVYLAPYEPDILGEFFVLKFLEPSLLSHRTVTAFANALWRSDTFSLGGWNFVRRALDDFPDHPTLPYLIEPSEELFSSFGNAAFYEFVSRKAESNIRLARQLLDAAKPLFRKNALSGLVRLGYTELAQKLCLCYLDFGNLDDAKLMYKEVVTFEQFGNSFLFTLSRVSCAWALSDYSIKQNNLLSAMEYFEDAAAGLITIPNDMSLVREQASKGGSLSIKFVYALSTRKGELIDKIQFLQRTKRGIGSLLRRTGAPDAVRRNAELQSGWWSATLMLNVEYLRDSVSRACEDLPDILRAAEEFFDPLEEEPPGLSKAVRSLGLATILDSIFFEIVLHDLSRMKPNFVGEWKEEQKLIAHEADLIRQEAAEILGGSSLPLSVVNKRWRYSLILSVSTIVRFCGLNGRSEDADSYRDLLRSAVELDDTDTDEMVVNYRERIPDALVFCVIAHCAELDVCALADLVNELKDNYPKLKVDWRFCMFMGLAIGTAPERAKNESDKKVLEELGKTIYEYFLSAGVVESLMAATNQGRAEAEGIFRGILLE